MAGRLALLLLVLADTLLGAQTPLETTFSNDVAPIVFARCAGCHRPGGSAPFSLVTYAEASARARQIAAVTKSRYMPPWRPEPGYGEFAGERRLTDEEIATIERWVTSGAREGDRSRLPPAPTWSAGWQVGQPDLVLTLPEYTVPASGETDLYRNFVVDVPAAPGAATRYVRGLEFLPGNTNVHHANIFVDRTAASRRLDDEDPLAGYSGLIPNSAMFPDGHFLGWTPGQAPPLAPAGLSWRLENGSSLLVQLHLQATGKPERIRPSIGLFFTNEPPTRTPVMLRLGRQSIDIPPGDKAYVVSDSFTLPVDAEVQAVQPHAHLRAREVRAWADLPDGSRRWLILVRQWDFKWQDQYRYAQPFWLPAGTALHLEYVYDNSADNPHNPDMPPRRVVWGFRSSDEMGDVWVQLLARTDADRVRLFGETDRKMTAESIVGLETQIAVRPDYAAIRNDVAVLYIRTGQAQKAAAHFAQVVRLEPRSAAARFNLGSALQASGDVGGATAEYREALRLDPSHARAHARVGEIVLSQGRVDEAIVHLREATRLDPTELSPHYNLGVAEIAAGRLADAVAPLERAVQISPSFPEARYNLARVLAGLHRYSDAIAQLRSALVARPDWTDAMAQLSWLLATHPDAAARNPDEAIALASRAAELSGRKDASVLDSLAAAYASAGRFQEAVASAEAAEKLASGSAPVLVGEIRARLALYRAGRPVVQSVP
jgi:tetratricopeptide (TPR) repeat protein